MLILFPEGKQVSIDTQIPIDSVTLVLNNELHLTCQEMHDYTGQILSYGENGVEGFLSGVEASRVLAGHTDRRVDLETGKPEKYTFNAHDMSGAYKGFKKALRLLGPVFGIRYYGRDFNHIAKEVNTYAVHDESGLWLLGACRSATNDDQFNLGVTARNVRVFAIYTDEELIKSDPRTEIAL